MKQFEPMLTLANRSLVDGVWQLYSKASEATVLLFLQKFWDFHSMMQLNVAMMRSPRFAGAMCTAM